MSSTLNIPIYVNRGNEIPSSLGEGELYLHLGPNELYVGMGNSAPPVKVSCGAAITNGTNKIDESSIRGFTLQEIPTLQLTSDSYGHELPNIGVEGQLFFLIPKDA